MFRWPFQNFPNFYLKLLKINLLCKKISIGTKVSMTLLMVMMLIKVQQIYQIFFFCFFAFSYLSRFLIFLCTFPFRAFSHVKRWPQEEDHHPPHKSKLGFSPFWAPCKMDIFQPIFEHNTISENIGKNKIYVFFFQNHQWIF